MSAIKPRARSCLNRSQPLPTDSLPTSVAGKRHGEISTGSSGLGDIAQPFDDAEPSIQVGFIRLGFARFFAARP